MADEIQFEMHDIPASSRLTAWGYNEEAQKARAIFPKTGRSAIYSGVPRDVFEAVLNAPSVGSAFGALIVGGGFPFEYED
jgi:KTSC domain